MSELTAVQAETPDTLHHLTSQLTELEYLFDQLDDDLSATLVLEQFERMDLEWTEKLQRCVEYRRRQIGKQAGLQTEIAELQKPLDKAKKRQERMEKYLRYCLEARQLKRAEAGHYTLRIQGNGGKPPLLIDEEKLPREWWKTPPVAEVPNKEQIRIALEAGREIPGARIGQPGSRLVIE